MSFNICDLASNYSAKHLWSFGTNLIQVNTPESLLLLIHINEVKQGYLTNSSLWPLLLLWISLTIFHLYLQILPRPVIWLIWIWRIYFFQKNACSRYIFTKLGLWFLLLKSSFFHYKKFLKNLSKLWQT